MLTLVDSIILQQIKLLSNSSIVYLIASTLRDATRSRPQRYQARKVRALLDAIANLRNAARIIAAST